LDQTEQAYAILGAVLTADSDIVDDAIMDLPIESDNQQIIYSYITGETFNLIDEGLSDVSNILNECDEIETPDPFVITDGDGICYKLCRVTYAGNDNVDWMQMIYDANGTISYIPLLQKFDDAGSISYRFNNIINSFNQGKYRKTITSWLNSLSITSTLNAITNSVVNLCVKGRATVSSIYSTVCQFTTSKISSIRQWAMTYINIFNESGLSGVVNYILRSLNSVGNNLYDNDGAMAFTDNNQLIPKEFIGTMIATAATTIGTMLVAFSGIVGKIIGAALTIGGGIISWFSKTAWGNYQSETLAGLIDTDAAGEVTVLPEAPHAMCQFEMSINTIGDYIVDIMEQNSGIMILQVPGGFLHVGPSKNEGYLRCEFHPHAFWTFHDLNCQYFLANPKNSGSSQGNAAFAVPMRDMNASALETTWNSGYDVGAEYEMSDNWNERGGQVFTESSDLKLREVIARNTGFFLLWLSAISNYYSGPSIALPISRQLMANGPKFAIELSNLADPVGWYGNSIKDFIVHAFLPISMKFTPRFGIDGTLASEQTAKTPTWQELGTVFSNQNATQSVAESSFIANNGFGVNVAVNYYISSGIWYPQIGTDLFVAVDPSLQPMYNFAIKNPLYYVLKYKKMLGDADFVNASLSSGVYTPKYNRETYWFWVGAVTAVTVIVAVTTVIASVKIKKAIKKKRASNAAKVEAAWANLVENPTSAQAQSAYYKAAKKANLWSKVIGGTTFDTSNYWSGGSDDVEPKPNKLMNYVAGYDTSEPTQSVATDSVDGITRVRLLIDPNS
jgi:hypothetical protein